MIRRFAAGTAVATGLALSLTGCLGGEKDKGSSGGNSIQLTAAQVLDKAAQKTSSTDSFKASLSMTGTAEGESMTMAGSMQYRSKPDIAYNMRFDQFQAAGQNLGSMEQVLVNKTMYMKAPFLTQLMQMGGRGAAVKPWIKVSLAEISQKAGMNLDQLLQQSQQMDPVQNTKMLTASKDVREVGKESVEGVQTTHYSGTYKLADALAKLPPEQQKMLQKAMAQTGMSSVPFDLWVDEQQLPKKMTMDISPDAKSKMKMTMTYRDYGKPVDITVPPADQVSDISEMLKNMPRRPGAPTPN